MSAPTSRPTSRPTNGPASDPATGPAVSGRAATGFLPYRPPYHWQAMLAFLAARAVPATEQVAASTWHRSLRLEGVARQDDAGEGIGPAGTVSVTDEPQQQALRVVMSPQLAGHEAEVLARLGRMFDVDCDPQAVEDALGPLAAANRGLRLPGTPDPFELMVRAILGQQVTVAAARTIATRFVARFGVPLPNAMPDEPGQVTHLFPSAARIAAIGAGALGEIGIIRARGEAIIAAARALDDGTLQLVPGAPVEPALASLTTIRGIGPWTAHYVAMRALGWRDAFPPRDVAVLKAMQVRTPAEAARQAEGWRPWRSYAVLHLWRSLAVSAN